MATQNATNSAGILVTTFNNSGTWTKNSRTNVVDVIVLHGGNGGASGRQGSTTAAGGGGGGGCGGGIAWSGLPAAIFSASGETVTIGLGGTGGTGQSSAASNGINGSPGGASSLGNISTNNVGAAYLVATGGTTTSAAAGQGSPFVHFMTIAPIVQTQASVGFAGGAGGNVTGSNATSNTISAGFNSSGTYNYSSNYSYLNAGAGGGGSGADIVTARQAGNGSNYYFPFGTTIISAGGAGGIETGTIDGQPGNAGLTSGGIFCAGTGGGGGGGQKTGLVAGKGGQGGTGAGGGGGGGSITGTTSGAGGDGGKGQIIVIEYF